MSNNVHNTTSTRREDWGTPLSLFHELQRTFNFVVDLAADELNTLCDHYVDEEMDIFSPRADDVVRKAVDACSEDGPPYAWLNPPYKTGGRTGDYVTRAYQLVHKTDMGLIALVPASVGAQWWVENVCPMATVVVFTPRLKFQGAKHGAQFDTALAVNFAMKEEMEYTREMLALSRVGRVFAEVRR